MKPILLIDDDKDVAHLYKTLLDYGGYRSVVATSREQALESIDAEAPALVLLDCNMPGMSIESFVVRVREKIAAREEAFPILGFSSFAPGAPTVVAAQRYLTDFVEKPDDIEGFLEIIRRYLN